jgi:quercetin dioxygenase-like cupin family protein
MPSVPLVVDESNVPLTTWSDPVRGAVGFRTLIGDASRTDSLTAGVTEIEPGDWLGLHRHEPSELYYILTGEGTVIIGGEEQTVRSGSAVFIPGNVEHGIQNTGTDDLRLFFAFAVGSSSDIVYRFSATAASHETAQATESDGPGKDD